MVTLDSFDLTDSKRSLSNSADPSPALMRLYLMAPTISALSAVLTAAFFSLSAHFIFFVPENTDSRDAALRPIDSPPPPPPVSKSAPVPGTLCWPDLRRERSVAPRRCYRERDLISCTVASAGTTSSPERGSGRGEGGEPFQMFFGRWEMSAMLWVQVPTDGSI